MSQALRLCALVPTYNNPETVRSVVGRLRERFETVILVDDGSHTAGRQACDELAHVQGVKLVRHASNQGKGAAIKSGLAEAQRLGFSHAFQIDADGQHDLMAIPRFVQAAAKDPEAAIIGSPVYDESVNKGRLLARKITRFWVNLELGSRRIVDDPMIGFRVYPVASTAALPVRSNWMDYDVEVAVRLAWTGTPIVNEPVGIRYLSKEEGGRSHFRPWRDNFRLTMLHCRLCTEASMNSFFNFTGLIRLPWARRLLGKNKQLPSCQSQGPSASGAHTPLKEPDDLAWLSSKERGSILAMKAGLTFATLFGRRLTRPIVSLIAWYYTISDRRARRTSRQWLTRVREATSESRGSAPRVNLLDTYRHVRHFAQVIMDRMFFLKGKTTSFEISRHGNQHLEHLTRSGQGAVLLGAHLGSYEALRAAGKEESFSVHMLGHFNNAKMINAFIDALDPDMAARVVHIGNDPVQLAVTLKDRIAEGHMIAMHADRVGLGDRVVEVPFFGRRARFPAGPFLLAAVLKCPVLTVFALYHEPNHYELLCEPFKDRIVLPRGNRDAALQEVVEAYVERLETVIASAPLNWFNFYDFWGTGTGRETL